MSCDHSLIFGETSNKKPCLVCLDCFKAEPVKPEKDFVCKCGNDGTESWKFNLKSRCISCADCKRIITN